MYLMQVLSVAVRCSMLQHVAVCCRWVYFPRRYYLLQWVKMGCNVLRYVAVCSSVLHYVALGGSMLHCVVVRCSLVDTALV